MYLYASHNPLSPAACTEQDHAFLEMISVLNEPSQRAALSERTTLAFIQLLKCQGSHQLLQVAALVHT